jgi:hypothetical protein
MQTGLPPLRGQDVAVALRDLPPWHDRILIDATNQFIGPGELEDLHGRVSSVIVADHAPGARVVKALNTLCVSRLEAGPAVSGGRRIVCISGDDADATAAVAGLISPIGFEVINLGSLREGGLLQQAGGQLAGKEIVTLE